MELSLSEIIVIVLVAVIFIGPKDLPVVIRTIGKWFASLREIASELRQGFDDLSRESGLQEIKKEVEYIIDQDGNYREIYDISDLKRDKPSTAITDESKKE